MFEKMKQVLEHQALNKADYADLRYETKQETAVHLSRNELTQAGVNLGDGFVVRVLKNGGLAEVAFTKLQDAPKAVARAVENATLLGKNRPKQIALAPSKAAKDTVVPRLHEDPRRVSLEEKISLLREYQKIPLGHEKIVNSMLALTEVIREKHFISTEGHAVREDLVTVQLQGMISSREGALLQNVRIGDGGSDGFQTVRNIEPLFEEKTKLAIDLLDAKPIKGGKHDVIVNPELAGVFIHEAFGHFSEADIIEELPAMREKMRLDTQIGNPGLSVVDDPGMRDQLGYYRYDDEGTAARRVQLIKDGVLTGRLHSRRTAAEFGEPVTGHMIAEDYRFAPIVRMGNIYIEPGTGSFEQLLEELNNGYYILDVNGGQTTGENFTFGAQYGYEVKNGKRGHMVRDINISGNLYRTLMNITALGNKLVLSKIGGCGKGQSNIRSCNGGPDTLIRNLVVGGV